MTSPNTDRKARELLALADEAQIRAEQSAKFAEVWLTPLDTFFDRVAGVLRRVAALQSSPTPAGEGDDWLLRQLEAWPTRVDKEKTTNIEFLMKQAAARIRALSPRPSRTEGDVERAALLFARETIAARAVRNGCQQVATEWRCGIHDALPDVTMRVEAYLEGHRAALASLPAQQDGLSVEVREAIDNLRSFEQVMTSEAEAFFEDGHDAAARMKATRASELSAAAVILARLSTQPAQIPAANVSASTPEGERP